MDTDTSEQKQQWEYKIACLDFSHPSIPDALSFNEKTLNSLGENGWECIGSLGHKGNVKFVAFKRPK